MILAERAHNSHAASATVVSSLSLLFFSFPRTFLGMGKEHTAKMVAASVAANPTKNGRLG